MRTDSKWTRWAKILSHYQSIVGSDARNNLVQTNSVRQIKVKVLKSVSLLLLWALPSFGANPSFQSFDTNYFKTNGNVIRPAPNILTNNQTNVTLSGTFNGSVTNIGATLDGVQIFTTGLSGGYDNYLLDFGKRNTNNQILIYQSILATNNVKFTALTNCVRWSLLSLNVIASGTNVTVQFPTNLPHLDTNGLTIVSAGVHEITITNGNEFRLTLQSNITLSSLWATFGQ